jgi:hypothetical protein
MFSRGSDYIKEWGRNIFVRSTFVLQKAVTLVKEIKGRMKLMNIRVFLQNVYTSI